jgi:hypothetical protein
MEILAKVLTFILFATCMICVAGILTRIIDRFFPAFLRWLLCER